MSPINETNAYAFSDNYSIVDSSGFVVGCEHNESEALVLACWLESNKGILHRVRRNSREDVNMALALVKNPFRHPLRMEAFESHNLGKRNEIKPSRSRLMEVQFVPMGTDSRAVMYLLNRAVDAVAEDGFGELLTVANILRSAIRDGVMSVNLTMPLDTPETVAK